MKVSLVLSRYIIPSRFAPSSITPTTMISIELVVRVVSLGFEIVKVCLQIIHSFGS